MSINLSIILPSLRLDNMSKCIASIWANTPLGTYEIITDTDSREGPIFAINKCLPKTKGEYIVTLSDDARVLPKWYENMLSFMQENEKTFDGPLIGNFRIYNDSGELGDIGYYNHAFSCFPFIKRETIDKLGGYYSPEYHAYFSDPDLGMRCFAKGGKVITCPNAWIFHCGNSDPLYVSNHLKYMKEDETTFRKKWDYLGTYIDACAPRINPNIIKTHPSPTPTEYLK